MKVIARVHFNRYPTQHHVAVYQDGVGIRQTGSGDSDWEQPQQDIWLDFDEIEAIAKLARKHRKTAARLEKADNDLLERGGAA